MTKKASVIIPTFNGGDLLLEVCKKLLVQDYKDSWEIIIIDSESSDDSINQIQELFNNSKIPFKLITINKIDFQHGKTRNQAIKQSSGEIILLLTQDSLPVRDNWLSVMVKTFEDKNIAGVFGRHIAHLNHPKLIQRDLDLHFERMNELPIRKINDWNEYENNISLRQTLHFFSNNNSGLRRTVWEEIPFPNVDFGEDQTWAKKVIEAGYTLAYEKESIVYHSHHFSMFELYKRAITEIKFFDNYFNYELRISFHTAVNNIISDTLRDINYLNKKKSFKLRDYSYCFKKNLVAQIAHSKKLIKIPFK
jgi:rhamnosyltransferase